MADLTVDLDGLTTFASELDRIRGSLDSAGATFGAQHGDLGSDTVSAALDDFSDHWHDGRKKVTDNAKSLSSMVHESVDTYRRTDSDLSTAIQQSSQGG